MAEEACWWHGRQRRAEIKGGGKICSFLDHTHSDPPPVISHYASPPNITFSFKSYQYTDPPYCIVPSSMLIGEYRMPIIYSPPRSPTYEHMKFWETFSIETKAGLDQKVAKFQSGKIWKGNSWGGWPVFFLQSILHSPCSRAGLRSTSSLRVWSYLPSHHWLDKHEA